MRFDNYFWDFDGTLMDSYPLIIRSFQQGAASLGVTVDRRHMMDLAKISIGHMTRTVAAESGLTAESLKEAYDRAIDASDYSRIQPYEGIPAILEAIVRRSGKNFLYTHSGNRTLDALANFGMKRFFTDYITADNRFPAKPAPNALVYMIEKYGLDTSRSVMVGDRDIDVQAGLNAGIAGALFDPDGYYDHMPFTYRFKSMQAMRDTFLQ
jgi:phosphoglycolate phosphatase-like HAD superfamily hydrolase